ncbi:hypothetical protein [Caballeronia glebae]|uniref:hypothetical protein n=1 Tax=Caballeronia glebae TaxID=1777143 RepID=UPI0038BC8EB7
MICIERSSTAQRTVESAERGRRAETHSQANVSDGGGTSAKHANEQKRDDGNNEFAHEEPIRFAVGGNNVFNVRRTRPEPIVAMANRIHLSEKTGKEPGAYQLFRERQRSTRSTRSTHCRSVGGYEPAASVIMEPLE